MSMISKQIELLRSQAEYEYRILKDKLMAKLLSQAADTIEMLSEKAREPKQGKWMGDKCSVCGSERAWYGNNPPYCPDCGAKMEGADDD